ncbi:pilus assembly FimT family protein [Aeoliella sp.]|uniref:pilus assembly FimT family protein n=1 Tax=Aeoliella sp. TaxID=2795800 RepID=UPI003CCBDE5E
MKNRRGYSFVELMIVVLIMGILAAAAAPKFTAALDNNRADGAARRIAADLNRLRAEAMITSSSSKPSVTFDADSEVYGFSGLADPDHPSRAYKVSLSSTSYPADIVAAKFLDSDNDVETTLKYDLYGRPWCGSDEERLVDGSISVSSGDVVRSVVIDPVTGAARVAD